MHYAMLCYDMTWYDMIGHYMIWHMAWHGTTRRDPRPTRRAAAVFWRRQLAPGAVLRPHPRSRRRRPTTTTTTTTTTTIIIIIIMNIDISKAIMIMLILILGGGGRPAGLRLRTHCVVPEKAAARSPPGVCRPRLEPCWHTSRPSDAVLWSAWRGMARGGVRWDGMGWDGMGWDGRGEERRGEERLGRDHPVHLENTTGSPPCSVVGRVCTTPLPSVTTACRAAHFVPRGWRWLVSRTNYAQPIAAQLSGMACRSTWVLNSTMIWHYYV